MPLFDVNGFRNLIGTMVFDRKIANVVGFRTNEKTRDSIFTLLETEDLPRQVDRAAIGLFLTLRFAALAFSKLLKGLIPIYSRVAQYLARAVF